MRLLSSLAAGVFIHRQHAYSVNRSFLGVEKRLLTESGRCFTHCTNLSSCCSNPNDAENSRHHPEGGPPTWKELESIIIQGKFDQLSRSPDNQRSYDLFNEQLKGEWRSPYDYMVVQKFGVPKYQSEEDGLWRAGDQTEAQTTLKLAPNTFPYWTPPSVDHWVLWSLGAPCSRQDIENVKEELRQLKKGQELEFLHWKNPPRLQSLPNIEHVHIFVHSKDESNL